MVNKTERIVVKALLGLRGFKRVLVEGPMEDEFEDIIRNTVTQPPGTGILELTNDTGILESTDDSGSVSADGESEDEAKKLARQQKKEAERVARQQEKYTILRKGKSLAYQKNEDKALLDGQLLGGLYPYSTRTISSTKYDLSIVPTKVDTTKRIRYLVDEKTQLLGHLLGLSERKNEYEAWQVAKGRRNLDGIEEYEVDDDDVIEEPRRRGARLAATSSQEEDGEDELGMTQLTRIEDGEEVIEAVSDYTPRGMVYSTNGDTMIYMGRRT